MTGGGTLYMVPQGIEGLTVGWLWVVVTEDESWTSLQWLAIINSDEEEVEERDDDEEEEEEEDDDDAMLPVCSYKTSLFVPVTCECHVIFINPQSILSNNDDWIGIKRHLILLLNSTMC